MWENICHSLSLIRTLVFLLFVSAPRYTGLRRSKDDPSLFGKRPSVTRIPSTRRWKVLFSTLNSTCAHANRQTQPSTEYNFITTVIWLWYDTQIWENNYCIFMSWLFMLQKRSRQSLNSAFLTRRVICLVEIHALCKFYKCVHMKPDRNRNKFRFILKLCIK